MLVFHRMGQQVKFETISAVAGAILDEAREQGGVTKGLAVHVSRVDDQFLARAEVGSHEVHVYEAYWAPLTEGLVSYRETLKFLFQAGWQGLRYSRPFSSRIFQRRMFGGPQDLAIGASTFPAMLAVLAVLAAQVVIIALVSARVVRWLAAFTSTGTLPEFGGAAWLVLWILAIVEALVVRYFLVQYVGDIAAYVSPYKGSKFDEVRTRIQKVGWMSAR